MESLILPQTPQTTIDADYSSIDVSAGDLHLKLYLERSYEGNLSDIAISKRSSILSLAIGATRVVDDARTVLSIDGFELASSMESVLTLKIRGVFCDYKSCGYLIAAWKEFGIKLSKSRETKADVTLMEVAFGDGGSVVVEKAKYRQVAAQ